MTLLTWQKIVERDLGFILLTSFLLRLIITPLFYDDYNYWAFGVFTSFFVVGQNPYHIVAQDPTLLFINIWRYPPLYLLFTTPALLAKQVTGQTLVYLAALKIPFALADVVSTFYLFKILTRFVAKSTALKFAAFFAFNPVVVFESAGGGFNDPIPIALTVASFYYFLKARDSSGLGGDLPRSALLLGLGIASKIYPLLLVPVLVRELKGTRARTLYLLLSIIPAISGSIPFLLWDWHSYIDLLTIRNIGGQHPLFPGLEFSGIVALTVAAILASSLLFVYTIKSSLMSRVVLLFLWVNLAVFAQSFNYMIWGVPFFTLFVAKHRKWFWMPLSPIVTMLVALVFQGSFNGVTGSTGLFYWTFHLFQLQITPLKASFLYNPVVFSGLLASEVLAGYYFLSVARPRSTVEAHPSFVAKFGETIIHGILRRKLFLSALLSLLVLLSWSTVTVFSNFQPRQYPLVEGTTFEFRDDFHSSLLDYQWVFGHNGTYSLNASRGAITLVDASNGTAHILRGWSGVTEGFHTSTSARASFRFKFDGLPPGSSGMTLANMTDGQLVVERRTITSFAYVDQLNDIVTQMVVADSNWHDFAIQYNLGMRTMILDSSTWTSPGGTFARFILGNSDSRPGFRGNAEFSNVKVQVNDFPTGYQSQFASGLALLVPPLLVMAIFGALSQRFRNLAGLSRKRERPT